MKKLVVNADVNKLDEVLAFLDGYLDEADCSSKAKVQLDIAVEELFVNIASYAYGTGSGDATITIEHTQDPSAVTITFEDTGRQFDPLAKEDPDTTLSAEERNIGGLGIYMVKKSMDDVRYEYKEGKNILSIYKLI